MNANIGNVPHGPLMNMLQNLSGKDLVHMFQVNKQSHFVCQDDHFWKERTYQKIQEFQKLKDTYFPNETSYKKIYTTIRANKTTEYTYGSQIDDLYIEWSTYG